MKQLIIAWTAVGIGLTSFSAVKPDPYAYKELTTTAATPVEVRQGLFDFGKDGIGWLELVGLPKGGYEVVLGEMTNALGQVTNSWPKSSIRCHRVTGTVEGDLHRVPLPKDKLNLRGHRADAPAILLPERLGVVTAFRYVQVVKAPGEVKAANLRRQMVHYPIDMTQSSFSCDNQVLNDVYELCKYSILATSFCGVYVDGDRERTPYEGDCYINQLDHYAIENDYSLARKSHEWLMDHATWPTEWKQHSIKIAWADWMWSGDTRSLAKHYQALCGKLLGNFERKDIVDWPLRERDGFVMTNSNSVVEAFNCRNLVEMAEIAAALGRKVDAADFAARAEKAKADFRAKFVDPETRLVLDGEGVAHSSLHGNAAALAFGLVSEGDVAKVIDFLDRKGMVCSVYFAQYLLEAFCEAERHDLAVKYMTAEGDRGWKGMMDFGSTITMEAWNVAAKPNLDLNHAWGAAPLNIISRYLLGVTPAKPGFRKISIVPRLGTLKRMKGVVPTAVGPVRIEADGDDLTVVTPGPARIDWYGNVCETKGGTVKLSKGN